MAKKKRIPEANDEPADVPEPELPPKEATIPAPDEYTDFTGEVLKTIRERKGMTLREIYDVTRIGVPSLSAVEDERYEDLPNARIYVRGFVRCIATELGLDPDKVSKSYLPRWERWHESQKTHQKQDLR